MWQTKFRAYQKQINQALIFHLPKNSSRVQEAATYSLLAGGKRLRPILLLVFYQILSGKKFTRDILKVASSLEYAHTFSLIHDDLPGIDNDVLRRGQPTCHAQFDEATAILAGDWLYGYSLENIAKSNLTAQVKIALIEMLAFGMRQVIDGEMLDILGEHQLYDRQQLAKTHTLKTASFFQAILQMASLLSGKTKANDYRLAKMIGLKLGLAFQIQDDVLGVIGDSKKLGKSVGIDERDQKSTWVKLYGLPQAQVDYLAYYHQVIKTITQKLPDSCDRQFLLDLLNFLKNRDH